MAPGMGTSAGRTAKGLRRFLGLDQQRDWLDGRTDLPDADQRSESLELRFKYTDRFQKLLRRPQAEEVLEILGLYGRSCIPMPRRTDKLYEYACHEGNHAMTGILAGARLLEKEAAEQANTRGAGRSTR